MPTFGKLPQTSASTGIKIEVKLAFGGPSDKFGSFGGIGIEMGVKRQLFRMDWHKFDEGHGGSSGTQTRELKVLKDGHYHMHVYEWNKFGE